MAGEIGDLCLLFLSIEKHCLVTLAVDA